MLPLCSRLIFQVKNSQTSFQPPFTDEHNVTNETIESGSSSYGEPRELMRSNSRDLSRELSRELTTRDARDIMHYPGR